MKTPARFVVCIDSSEYPTSLELHKIYRVLPDKDAQADGDMRIIDESGEDYLFPAECFVELPQTAAAMARFLQQFGTGHGDYSQDRHEWLDSQDLDTIVKRIEEMRKSSGKSKKTKDGVD